jgi:hypothetical protein
VKTSNLGDSGAGAAASAGNTPGTGAASTGATSSGGGKAGSSGAVGSGGGKVGVPTASWLTAGAPSGSRIRSSRRLLVSAVRCARRSSLRLRAAIRRATSPSPESARAEVSKWPLLFRRGVHCRFGEPLRNRRLRHGDHSATRRGVRAKPQELRPRDDSVRPWGAAERTFLAASRFHGYPWCQLDGQRAEAVGMSRGSRCDKTQR